MWHDINYQIIMGLDCSEDFKIIEDNEIFSLFSVTYIEKPKWKVLGRDTDSV